MFSQKTKTFIFDGLLTIIIVYTGGVFCRRLYGCLKKRYINYKRPKGVRASQDTLVNTNTDSDSVEEEKKTTTYNIEKVFEDVANEKLMHDEMIYPVDELKIEDVADTHPYVLVINSMQPRFIKANNFELVKKIEEELKTAMNDNAYILIMEQVNISGTHQYIKGVIGNYPETSEAKYINNNGIFGAIDTKKQFGKLCTLDISHNIIKKLKDENVKTNIIKLCGLNTDCLYMIYGTAIGLSFYNNQNNCSYQIKIIENLCTKTKNKISDFLEEPLPDVEFI